MYICIYIYMCVCVVASRRWQRAHRSKRKEGARSRGIARGSFCWPWSRSGSPAAPSHTLCRLGRICTSAGHQHRAASTWALRDGSRSSARGSTVDTSKTHLDSFGSEIRRPWQNACSGSSAPRQTYTWASDNRGNASCLPRSACPNEKHPLQL